MQITKEETGALTASIKLLISKDDYEEKVTKTLKDYQRKANLPGFRPGKVPFGMVAKMYRKGVMLDEINHLLAENLQNFIEENKLKLIGNPLPNKEKAPSIDLDEQSDFEFHFDIGLAPEFNLDLSENISVDYYKITATDKMIDDQIHEIRHRAVNQKHHEEHESEEEHHHEEHEGEVEHSHADIPDLNEEFFNKVFPGEEIKDETAFRAKIKEAIEQSLAKESERFFMNSAIETLVTEAKIELPDDFLRKMIRENDENKLTEEEIEAQYDNFARSMKWQMIESRLIQENNLRVEESEMRNVVRSYFTGLSNNAMDEEQEERLNNIVDSVLSNKEESNRLHDQLFDQKLLGFFKTRLKLEHKEADYDEFVKLITQKKV
jgi:trigger factor